MSNFFSNKYLKYRQLLERGAPSIDHDVPCANCGYNIRGLTAGRKCPECGRVIPLDFETVADPLLSGGQGRRAMTMWGLSLMSAAAIGFILLRLGYGVMWALSRWPPPAAYFSFAGVLAIVWIAGVWMGTPSSLDVRRRGSAPLRWLARLSQVLWLAAAIIPLVVILRGAWAFRSAELIMFTGVLTAIAGLGWIGLAFLLLQVAEDLELDEAPRRIGMAIWVVPVLGALMLVLPLQFYFFMLALLSPILLVWSWYLLGFARGVLEMRQYLAWGMKQAFDVGDREARVAATRAELETEARSRIRDLPPRPHAPPTRPGRIPDR